MAPQVTGVGSSSSVSFPEGTVVIDESLVDEIQEQFDEEVLSSFKKFDVDGNQMLRLATSLLGDGEFYSWLNFHETSVPFGPFDVFLNEGARAVVFGQTDQGTLSYPQPIMLEGVSTFWDLIKPDRIQKNSQGGVEIGDGCFFVDITEQTRKSPIGTLFPGPVNLKTLDWLKFARMEAPTVEGPFSKIKEAADLLSVRVCPNALYDLYSTDPLNFCKNTDAGIGIYLDFQKFLNLLETEGFRKFDFSGIEVGTFVHLPRFNLSLLSSLGFFPAGLSFEGEVDFTAWRPDEESLKIALRNFDADITLGDKPVHFQGDIVITLREGGGINVAFDHFLIELPSFPSRQEDVASLRTSLSGEIALHLDSSGALAFDEARLKFNDIDFATKPGKGLRVGNFAFAPSIQGHVAIDYRPSDLAGPLQTEWSLTGSALAEAGKQTFDLTNIRFEGKGGWQKINGRFLPKDLSLQARTEVKVGDFQFVPSVHLDLTSVEKGDGFQIDGDGDLEVNAASPEIQVGSSLHVSTTDLRNFDFSADFTKDQILGSVAAVGEMKVVGKLSRDDKKSLLKSFRIKTSKPYTIKSDDETVLKNVQIVGKGANRHSVITVRTPVATVDLWNLPWTDRLNGAYRIRRQRLGVNPEFALNNLYVRGKFSSPPFGELFEKKRVFLSGAASAGIGGKLEGPIAADYQATLRWAPEKSAFLLSFSPKRRSTLNVGPIVAKRENSVIEGNANLQGTLIARYGSGGIGIGGDDLGINQGKVFVGLDGPIMVDDQGQKIPAVYDLSFVADQLNGIRNGVAYCGGRRCRLEAVVNLLPVKVAFDPNRSKLPIFKTPHRIQISPAAWWKGLEQYIEDSQ